MARIQQLDDALVDQIAAGEVVERPSSVVKELLENSLDAGATTISVEIVEGGRERIRIVDDGMGMDPEDAAMCVKRHATSKIRTLQDLEVVQTMGFRGEALAAIASVSRFRLVTRARDAVQGTEVVVHGGAPAVLKPVGCPPGTSIEIDELFYNLPVRRNFLRARTTEAAHVGRTCFDVALAHPALRLSYTSNGRMVRQYLPVANLTERAQAEFDEPLSVIEGEIDGVKLLAVLESPETARTGLRWLRLFVNGRPFESVPIGRAVAFAFGDTLEKGKYPKGAVYLQTDPREVDPNAHPRKLEVRFARLQRVQDAITRILTKGLGTSRWDGGVEGGAAEARAVGDTPQTGTQGATTGGAPSALARAAKFWDERLPAGPSSKSDDDDDAAPAAGAPESTETPLELAAALREQVGPVAGAPATAVETGSKPTERASVDAPAPIGQAGGLFLFAWRSALHVVDPVALVRRATLADWNACAEALPSVRLMFPERVELSEEEVAVLVQRKADLEAFGLEVEALGDRTVAVHTLPSLDDRFVVECDLDALFEAALERDLRELAAARVMDVSLAQGTTLHDIAPLVARFSGVARRFDFVDLQGDAGGGHEPVKGTPGGPSSVTG